MMKVLDKLLRAFSCRDEAIKSYRNYLKYVHEILKDNLQVYNSAFIYRIGVYFIKSEYINDKWYLRINNIESEQHYISLKDIAMKEVYSIDINTNIIKNSYVTEDDFIIMYSGNNKNIILENFSMFIYSMLDSLFMRFNEYQKSKENNCLYQLKLLMTNSNISLEEYLEHAVLFIKNAWHFDEYAMVRISVGNKIFSTDEYYETILKMDYSFECCHELKCVLEVNYSEDILKHIEYPFLQVEKKMMERICTSLNGDINQILLKNENPLPKEKSVDNFKHLLNTDRLATLGQLVSGIINQINEPLGDILGYSQLLEVDETVDKQTKSDLNNIVNASLTVREIINRLMIFSGNIVTNLQKINVNETLNATIELLKSRSNKQDIVIETHFKQDLSPILMDLSQLHQILFNILLNAEQAIDKSNGVIKVTTEESNTLVIISITDNGSGIPDTLKESIFNPLFSTKKESIGTGIGLSVAKQLIESNNGSINFESKINIGTTFTITFSALREGHYE